MKVFFFEKNLFLLNNQIFYYFYNYSVQNAILNFVGFASKNINHITEKNAKK